MDQKMTAPDYAKQTQPFARGGGDVLIAALQERQHGYDEFRQDSTRDQAGPLAMPREEVLACLTQLGLDEGYDATATELFFGTDGQSGYTDGSERLAVETHGGFVFRDPDEGPIYTITCTSASGSRVEEEKAWARKKASGGGFARTIRCWLESSVLRGSGYREIRPDSPDTPRWSVNGRGLCYQVQPCFYEDMDSFDIGPYTGSLHDPHRIGIASLYPVEREPKVCVNTGSVNVSDADEALELARSLGQIMAEYGILCDPRVVLIESGDLPLLPRETRKQRLYEVEKYGPGKGADLRAHVEPEDSSPPEDFLHALLDDGHRINERDSAVRLVLDQEKAWRLEEHARWLLVCHERVSKLESRLEDTYIPERRKADLSIRLAEARSWEEQARADLEPETYGLAGLVLSLLDERPKLVDDALTHRKEVSR